MLYVSSSNTNLFGSPLSGEDSKVTDAGVPAGSALAFVLAAMFGAGTLAFPILNEQPDPTVSRTASDSGKNAMINFIQAY